MRALQFSIRRLLGAVAAVGIGAALWSAQRSWQVGLLQALLVMAMPACIFIAAMHRKGASRAFLLGVAFVATSSSVNYFYQLANSCRGTWMDSSIAGMASIARPTFFPQGLAESPVFFKIALFQWSLAPFVSLLCVFTHWLFVRSAEPKN